MRAGIVVTEIFILCAIMFSTGIVVGGVLEDQTGIVSHNVNNGLNSTVDTFLELSDSNETYSSMEVDSQTMYSEE